MENVGNEANRGRILNGKKSIEPWPWMAALYMPFDKSNPLDTDVSKYLILVLPLCVSSIKETKL